MIIRTALPLVAEYGTAVTTAKIARAAGIGEATIFRVFADKDELIDACLTEAARPDEVLDELGAIDLGLPLAERLEAATDTVYAHLGRMGTVIGALQATGHRPSVGCGRPGVEDAGEDTPGRDDAVGAIIAALTELLAPDTQSLRLPVQEAAALFFSLIYGLARPGAPAPAEPRLLVDILLNGALLPAFREGTAS